MAKNSNIEIMYRNYLQSKKNSFYFNFNSFGKLFTVSKTT